MPIHHAQVKARTSKVTAPFGELGEIEAQYDRAAITPEFLQRGPIQEGDMPAMANARFLAAVLKGWDYLDEKGKPFKTDQQTLEGLPMEIIDGVAGAIAEDLRPKPQPEPNSGSFS